jgi:hypothetical protein
METRRQRRSWWAAAAIAAATLAACGGATGVDDGEEGFKERLASIVEAASSQYGELAERADRVNPNTPLADTFKAQMRAVAGSDQRAADQIETLTPGQAAAAKLVRQLGAALRARAGAFERAAGATTITLRQLEEDGSITDAGEQIDRAVQQLREAGLVADEQPHNEP